jgi:peptidoglycan/LPS O-acetylase OafA/YrhL
VELFKAIMRFLSSLFHTPRALFVLAVSSLAMASGANSLHLDMLPWTGPTLTYVLFFGSLFGLLTILQALKMKLRALFFLWSLAVTILLAKGYFLSGYHFAAGEVRTALYLVAASILALFGAWFQMRRKPNTRRV